MANVGSPARGHYPDETYNVGAIKHIYVKFTVGATPSTITKKTLGEIASITNTGTGAYTIQFTQSYFQSLGMDMDVTQAAYSASGACYGAHVNDANEAKNGTLKILLLTAAGAAVNPANGDTVNIDFAVQVDSCLS